MAVAKVILNGTTLIDVTQKTVTASTLLQGETALKNDGTDITGTLVPSVAPTLQSKTVSPSTSQQTVTPDSGYDGLSQVTVNAMPSGSASTPATTITANPTISVNASGLITASVSKTQGVTPTVSAGYVASGTSGTITVNGSNTNQLTTKSAQTYTPTTSDQTIASGQYLIGTQTVKGDSNLLAENIKKDVVLFGVTGTLESGGGGASTSVSCSMNTGQTYIYVDAQGELHSVTYRPATTSFSADVPSKSLIVGYSTAQVPTLGTPTNTTLIYSKTYSSGIRQFSYYQAN